MKKENITKILKHKVTERITSVIAGVIATSLILMLTPLLGNFKNFLKLNHTVGVIQKDVKDLQVHQKWTDSMGVEGYRSVSNKLDSIQKEQKNTSLILTATNMKIGEMSKQFGDDLRNSFNLIDQMVSKALSYNDSINNFIIQDKKKVKLLTKNYKLMFEENERRKY